MAKLKNDYENSLFGRLDRWIRGGGSRSDLNCFNAEPAPESPMLSSESIGEREDAMYARHAEAQAKEQAMFDRIHNWSRTRGRKLINALYALLSVVICLSVILVLLETVSYLPYFGDEENPLNNEVSERYIE